MFLHIFQMATNWDSKSEGSYCTYNKKKNVTRPISMFRIPHSLYSCQSQFGVVDVWFKQFLSSLSLSALSNVSQSITFLVFDGALTSCNIYHFRIIYQEKTTPYWNKIWIFINKTYVYLQIENYPFWIIWTVFVISWIRDLENPKKYARIWKFHHTQLPAETFTHLHFTQTQLLELHNNTKSLWTSFISITSTLLISFVTF